MMGGFYLILLLLCLTSVKPHKNPARVGFLQVNFKINNWTPAPCIPYSNLAADTWHSVSVSTSKARRTSLYPTEGLSPAKRIPTYSHIHLKPTDLPTGVPLKSAPLSTLLQCQTVYRHISGLHDINPDSLSAGTGLECAVWRVCSPLNFNYSAKMNEEMRDFFIKLIRTSQDETSSDIRNQISRSESNVASRVASDILASEDRVSSHLEEQLSTVQQQMAESVNVLREETKKDNQTLFSSLNRVSAQTNVVQEVVEDFKTEVTGEVTTVKASVNEIHAAQVTLTARLDTREAAEIDAEAAVHTLRESVLPLSAQIDQHQELISRSDKRADLFASELKLLKDKQAKTEANMQALSSNPPSSLLPSSTAQPRPDPTTHLQSGSASGSAPPLSNVTSLYSECPPLPTSPGSVHKIQISQLALRFSPVSHDLIDSLADDFDDVEIARVAAAKKFLGDALKMDSDAILQVTVEKAWPAESENELIVKFSSKLDIDIVN